MDKIRDIIDIGAGFEAIIDWLTDKADWLFDFIALIVEGFLDGINWIFHLPPALVVIILFTALAWWVASRGVAIFYAYRFFADSLHGVLVRDNGYIFIGICIRGFRTSNWNTVGNMVVQV